MNFNNDAEIAARTLKQGTVLTLPGDMFPLGQALACDFGEQVRAPQLQQWCQMVRDEYERQTEKANRQRSQEAAPEAPDGRRDTDASNGGGSTVAVAQAGEDLEEELQARKAEVVQRLEDLDRDIEHIKAEQHKLSLSLAALDAALEIYNGS